MMLAIQKKRTIARQVASYLPKIASDGPKCENETVTIYLPAIATVNLLIKVLKKYEMNTSIYDAGVTLYNIPIANGFENSDLAFSTSQPGYK